MTEARTLKPIKTRHGHDAYCHVCWHAIYILWVTEEPPDNDRCPHGAKSSLDCPDAKARDGLSAFLAQCRRDGLLPPLPKEPSP